MTDPTFIKICGVKDVDTALHAAEAGANAIGLNFVEASPRFIDTATAREIAGALPEHVSPIALFCNHDLDTIQATLDETGIHIAQLHGNEPPRILDHFDYDRVIKALPFRAETAVDDAEPWEDVMILWDTPPRDTDTLTGGSGRQLDWEAVATYRREHFRRFMLSGGLTPENVAEAVRTVRPWAVDVSSGVESSRGVKDTAKIAAFCAAVRDASGST